MPDETADVDGRGGPVSMTGFARAEGAHAPATGGPAVRWAWELKSVNGRGLDIRVRLPQGFDQLDPEIRARAARRLARSNVQIGLMLDRETGTAELRLNEAVLGQVLTALEQVARRLPGDPPRPAEVLAMRGVLDVREPEENPDDREARLAALLESFDAALQALVAARASEGQALGRILRTQLDETARLVAAARASSAAQPAFLKDRLRSQVAQLLETSDLPEDRLAAEAALLVTKLDVREELDRLDAHIAAARELLESDEAMGRRFDFLIQEFNREANTLCSKAADMDLKKLGLDLKVVVDRMREQVQNVE